MCNIEGLTCAIPFYSMMSERVVSEAPPHVALQKRRRMQGWLAMASCSHCMTELALIRMHRQVL